MVFLSGTTIILLMVGIMCICMGWGAHALFTRWYLKKHMKEHPEYKMYLDLLNREVKKK